MRINTIGMALFSAAATALAAAPAAAAEPRCGQFSLGGGAKTVEIIDLGIENKLEP